MGFNWSKGPFEMLEEIGVKNFFNKIDDFKTLTIFGKSVRKIRFKGQDKGHSSELELFINSIHDGTPCPIPFDESYQTTLATFKVLESISTGRMIKL